MLGVGREIVENIRRKNMLPDDAPIGVVGGYIQSAEVEGDGRTLEFVVNTDDVDSDMDVVVPSGANTAPFMRNRKVFKDHSYLTTDVVGHVRTLTHRVRIGGGSEWRMRAYFVPGLPVADAIVAIAKTGSIGASIGFIARDYGKPTQDELSKYTKNGVAPKNIVRKWDWFETSIVGIPCNISCQSTAMQTLESRAMILDELVTKGTIKREIAEAFGLPRKSVPKIRCVVR